MWEQVRPPNDLSGSVDPVLLLISRAACFAIRLCESSQDSHPRLDGSWDSCLVDSVLKSRNVAFVPKRIEVSLASVFSKVELCCSLLPCSSQRDTSACPCCDPETCHRRRWSDVEVHGGLEDEQL